MDSIEDLVAIKTRYENCSQVELFNYLHLFENKWVFKNNKNINLYIQKALENFGLTDTFSYEEMYNNYRLCLYNVVYLLDLD